MYSRAKHCSRAGLSRPKKLASPVNSEYRGLGGSSPMDISASALWGTGAQIAPPRSPSRETDKKPTFPEHLWTRQYQLLSVRVRNSSEKGLGTCPRSPTKKGKELCSDTNKNYCPRLTTSGRHPKSQETNKKTPTVEPGLRGVGPVSSFTHPPLALILRRKGSPSLQS